jgi:hypothetical protein
MRSTKSTIQPLLGIYALEIKFATLSPSAPRMRRQLATWLFSTSRAQISFLSCVASFDPSSPGERSVAWVGFAYWVHS